MFEEINSWFKNGCNYQEGISLYDKFGDNAAYKSLFKAAQTLFNEKKLSALLADLRNGATPSPVTSQINAEVATSEPAPAVSQQTAIADPEPQTSQPATQLPELLQVTKLRDQTHAEIRALHPHLDILEEGEDLKDLATRLVRLAKANAQHWQRYNYMTEEGYQAPTPETAPEPVMIDLHLLQERERIRKSLNKAVNRAKKQTKPNAKTVELIKQQRQALADIDAKIARIKNGGKP